MKTKPIYYLRNLIKKNFSNKTNELHPINNQQGADANWEEYCKQYGTTTRWQTI